MLCAVAVPGSDVAATNWSGRTGSEGSCSGVNETDNSTLTYHRNSLTANNYSSVAWNINENVIPTALNVQAEHNPEQTDTDIVFVDANYSTTCGADWHPDSSDPGTTSVIGRMSCLDASGNGGSCNKALVRFDTSWSDIASTTRLRHNACHETGHAFGLYHKDAGGSCMGGFSTTAYSTHDQNHISNDL